MKNHLTKKSLFILGIALTFTLIIIISVFFFSESSKQRKEFDKQNVEYEVSPAWEIDSYIDRIMVEEGIGIDFDEYCRFFIYDLDTGKKIKEVDYSNRIHTISKVENSYNYLCEDNFGQYKIANTSTYLFTINQDIFRTDASEDFIIKFDAKNLEFEWFTLWEHEQETFNISVIDNYLIRHSEYGTYTFNLENGELLHHTTFMFIPTEGDYAHRPNSLVFKIEDKIYQYVFAKDRFITVEPTENKPVKHITVRNGIERNDSTFEWVDLTSPYLRMLNDRLAIAGDDKYFYIVDLIKGEIQHKMSKAELVKDKMDVASLDSIRGYSPDIFGDNVFLDTYVSEKGPTLVINYKTGKLITIFDISTSDSYELEQGILVSNGWGNIGLIDKKTFEFIWEKDYPKFSDIEAIEPTTGNIFFSDNHPDYGHCYQDCSSPKYWLLDIETGEKLKEVTDDEFRFYNCDDETENLCSQNGWVNLGDGGYRGFSVYDKNTKQKVYENEDTNSYSYLYKDLAIFRACLQTKKNETFGYDECTQSGLKAVRLEAKTD